MSVERCGHTAMEHPAEYVEWCIGKQEASSFTTAERLTLRTLVIYELERRTATGAYRENLQAILRKLP